MFTIKSKIVLAYTFVFGVLLVVLAIVVTRRVKEAEYESLDARLASVADKITTELEEMSDKGTPPDPRVLLSMAREGLAGARLQIFSWSGEAIIVDSVLARNVRSSPSGAPFANQSHTEDMTIGNQELRTLWLPSDPDDRIRYLVELASPTEEITTRLHTLLVIFFTGIPLALLVTAMAALVITRAAFRPMMDMVQTAQEITGANLDRRIPLPTARDEVRTLGDALNGMIRRIDEAFRSQQRFVADASHELRTPLTVICSELEFAAERATDPAVKESIRLSLSETDRLAQLADNLLLLARMDAAQLKLNVAPVRLDELLLDCVQRMAPIAKTKMIDVRVDVAEPVEVAADGEKLKSVFLNLLDNAIKYSPDRTVVGVSLAVRDNPDRPIVVCFEDHGCGIPASAIPNIFKRFYRVDGARADGRSYGLGLAIVQQLLDLHGGTISVESETGKGSVFTVELPLRRCS